MSGYVYICYYTLVSIIAGCSLYLYLNSIGIGRKILFGMACLLPTCFSLLFYGREGDLQTYDIMFDVIRGVQVGDILYLNNGWELGFNIFIKILSYVGNNIFIFWIISFLTVTLFLKTLVKDFENEHCCLVYLGYLFCVFPLSLNIVRQCFMVSILFCGIKYVFDKDLRKFLFVVLIATSIHATALIVIPLYFFWDKNSNMVYRWSFMAITLFSVVIYISFQILPAVLVNIFPFFSKMDYISRTGEHWNNRDIYIKLLVLVVLAYFYPRIKWLNEKYELFALAYIFVFVVGLTGFTVPEFKRITMIFSIMGIIVIGQIPDFYSIVSTKVVSKSILLASFIGFFIISSIALY